jgi:hypothetical protein
VKYALVGVRRLYVILFLHNDGAAMISEALKCRFLFNDAIVG